MYSLAAYGSMIADRVRVEAGGIGHADRPDQSCVPRKKGLRTVLLRLRPVHPRES